MRIESEISAKVLKVIADLHHTTTIAKEKALRVAAHDALVLVQDRVQQKGESLNGRMTTKSNKPNGAYSQRYTLLRNSKRLQTSLVDLTFDGDLFRNWQLIKSDYNSAEVGFTSQRESDKANHLEAYYGEIFALKPLEKMQVLQTFKTELNRNANY